MEPQEIKLVYTKWTCESNRYVNKSPCSCIAICEINYYVKVTY